MTELTNVAVKRLITYKNNIKRRRNQTFHLHNRLFHSMGKIPIYAIKYHHEERKF
jgi:hypothetical protein